VPAGNLDAGEQNSGSHRATNGFRLARISCLIPFWVLSIGFLRVARHSAKDADKFPERRSGTTRLPKAGAVARLESTRAVHLADRSTLLQGVCVFEAQAVMSKRIETRGASGDHSAKHARWRLFTGTEVRAVDFSIGRQPDAVVD
jgi:hypothetical protein